MQIKRIDDWIPARGVGQATWQTFGRVAARRPVAASRLSLAQLAGQAAPRIPVHGPPPVGKVKKVPPLVPAVVHQGPLAQRVERAKGRLKGARGVLGVGRKGGYATYWNEFNRQKDGLVAALTATQKDLDKVDGIRIAGEAQLQLLNESAGTTAPYEVTEAIDKASTENRSFADLIDTLRSTIDRLNASAQMVKEGQESGQAGAGSQAQQGLEKSFKEAKTLKDQVDTVRRAGATFTTILQNATRVVNRYVDKINAEAQQLLEKQKADDLAAQAFEREQEQARARKKAEDEAVLEAEERKRKRAEDEEERQRLREEKREELARKAQEAFETKQREYEELRARQEAQAAQAAQQQAPIQYAPPPTPPMQYTPPPPTQYDIYLPPEDYYARQAPVPSWAPPQAPEVPVAPRTQYAQRYVPDAETYGASEGFGAATGWGGQVWGYGVGQSAPSSAALTRATVDALMRRSNLSLGEARKALERRRIEEEERKRKEAEAKAATEAERMRQEEAKVPEAAGFWTRGRKIAAAVLVGLTAGTAAYVGSGSRRR